MLTFLYLPTFENMTDGEIHHINEKSMHHEKCRFALKFIRLLLFPIYLEFVQKCQCRQFCVFRKNAILREVDPDAGQRMVKKHDICAVAFGGHLTYCTKQRWVIQDLLQERAPTPNTFYIF